MIYLGGEENAPYEDPLLASIPIIVSVVHRSRNCDSGIFRFTQPNDSIQRYFYE